jgi:hypothetical protein
LPVLRLCRAHPVWSATRSRRRTSPSVCLFSSVSKQKREWMRKAFTSCLILAASVRISCRRFDLRGEKISFQSDSKVKNIYKIFYLWNGEGTNCFVE